MVQLDGQLATGRRARSGMKRKVVAALLGREISDAEWRSICSLLELIDNHADGEAVMERCIERGLTVEATIDELTRTRSPPID
jgi:hypothetical protein